MSVGGGRQQVVLDLGGGGVRCVCVGGGRQQQAGASVSPSIHPSTVVHHPAADGATDLVGECGDGGIVDVPQQVLHANLRSSDKQEVRGMIGGKRVDTSKR